MLVSKLAIREAGLAGRMIEKILKNCEQAGNKRDDAINNRSVTGVLHAPIGVVVERCVVRSVGSFMAVSLQGLTRIVRKFAMNCEVCFG